MKKRFLPHILTAAVALLLLLPPLSARADGTGVVTGDRVNLRSGPSTGDARLAYLYRGDQVTVTGQSGNWYAVTYAGDAGYVYKSYVSLNADAAGQTGAGVVTGNSVNLRAGPSTGYARLTYLYRGDRVTVTGESGSWYAVTFGSYRGYAAKAYVSLTEAPEGTDGDALRYGSRGTAVRTLQNNLILLGYLSGGADGIYGAKTRAAVLRYQSRNKLSADGVAGPATLAAISAEARRVNTVVSTAKAYLGLPYLYGGTSPETGFDCSGLTQYAFQKAGIAIPRVSYEQARAGVAVPLSQIRAGDLVAFHSPVSHVGIYVGEGKFIHSPKTGDVVKLTNLSAMNVTAVRRMTGVLAG